MLELNNIHVGDNTELLKELPNNIIDIMITSPPYNNNHPYDIYEDNKKHEDYIKWLKELFKTLKPKMVFGGRVCINIGDKHNGQIPTHSDIINFMTKDLEYLIKGTVIWHKHHNSRRTSWGSWMSPSNPSFPSPFEYILIFCNKSQRKVGDKNDITLTKDEFITNSNGIWTFAPEKNIKDKNHPAPFPIELPTRLIQQLSYKGDVVLDVFAGSGTTCLAAKKLERKWLGFELSPNYVEIANKRMEAVDEKA